jgi:hypothetical protein
VNGLQLVLEEEWLVCIVEHCREGYIYIYIYGKLREEEELMGYTIT